MESDVFRRLKRVLRVSQAKTHVLDAWRRRVFDAAMRQFSENPWAALNKNSDVLRRLVIGWGNPSWSANDEYLSAIIDEFSRTNGPVLECGSGLSTIVLGTLADLTGRRVWALENSEPWAERVRTVLDSQGIKSVRICVDPLKHYGEFVWYDPPLETLPEDFSLVICDGPPGDGYGGRFGFLPVMQEYLGERVSILLDDMARSEEQAVATRWAKTLDAQMENLGSAQPFAAIRAGTPATDVGPHTDLASSTITVGIPAFNSATTIGRAIDTILSQSEENLTLMVSDNASDDDTQEECLKRAAGDNRLRYYRQPKNIGVYDNYNDLLRKSRSKYFKWQSSSDWIDPIMLKACIEVLEARDDVVLVCPKVWLANQTGDLTPYDQDFGLEMEDPAERFSFLCDNIGLCNLFNGVIRTTALNNTSLNRPFLGSDVVLLAELALQGKFVLLDERLWFRLMTPSSASILQTSEQRSQFFSGASPAVGRRVTWKVMYALFHSVWRSRVDYSVKMRCISFLVQRTIWVREKLFRELF